MERQFIHIALIFFLVFGCTEKTMANSGFISADTTAQIREKEVPEPTDTLEFLKRLDILANGDEKGLWPVKNQPYPLKGAILPHKRIVAYYGNLYSKRMGVLGEHPPKEMWERLNAEVSAWEEADPATRVQPAVHYIAVVAQGTPTEDGKYCKRMPKAQIDSVLAIAKMGDAIVFLDIQVGQSTLQEEVPRLERYLSLPHVHLAVDPEFAMKNGHIPGHKIGSLNAADINYCSEYLAGLVRENNLGPKILIVHRFTQGMVRKHKNILLRPEVQIVINMDGWGNPTLKFSTYRDYIYREPVQFTGFKLFYKNDRKKPPYRLLTPPELMKLKPLPSYIQYQ
ncbi:hypothetical protein [Gaoshiqia sediminis]|uniref:Lipoprotein n=1 Tax=Gaoshiqia sediminis TaxID=2986998 RepID=A0AA41Y7Z1_9BACT|nr:hypothetical protein [Gaoshiqia sediminis]MCW0483525.1 hypothetical protein [Gaoshiqia sediminis]